MSIPKRYIHEQAVTQKKFLSRHDRLLHTSIGITHYNLKLSHIWGGLVALKTHGPMNQGCLYTQQVFIPWSSAFNHFVFTGLQILSLTTIPMPCFFHSIVLLRFLWLADSTITVSSLPFIVQKSKFNFSEIQLRHVKTRIQKYFCVSGFKSTLPKPYLKEKLL